jgi:hypothetical protein
MKKPLLLLAASAFALLASAQTTVTFNYTGSVQTFTVPPCVTSLTIDARGAQGGTKNACIGGNGGQVTCTMSVTPGEILNIYVGGAGTNGDNITGVIPGGFNGGGSGYDDTDPWGGAGGGGASDIRRTPYGLNNRVVVAGGGGGGGIDGCNSANQLAGGVGGGLTGGAGQPSPSGCVGSGQGGTQSAGGAKGQYTGCNNSSTDGSFGAGGNGYGNCSNSDDGGSGGGGGWYGGGAGNFGAGGGGSSYTDGTCTGVTHTQGIQSGAGVVMITYNPGTGVPNQPGVISGPSTICPNTTNTYSIAPVSGATSYTWVLPGGWSGSSTTTSISATANSTSGTISVTADNACGSSAAQTLSVTVNVMSSSGMFTAPTCNSACNGDAMAMPSGTGPFTYAWAPNGETTQTISNQCAGTYTVTVTGAAGCTAQSVITITQPAMITTSSPSANPTNICSGSCSQLTAGNVTGGTPGYTYTWMPGNLTGTTVSVCPTAPTVYTLTVNDANNCSANAVVTVNVNPSPVVTYNQSPNTMCVNWPPQTLSAGSPPGGTYSGPGVTGNTFDPAATGAGTFTVTYTFSDAFGCTDSVQQQITVGLCTGTGPESTLHIGLFPNPFNNEISIAGLPEGAYTLKLFNTVGELVLQKSISGPSYKLSTTALDDGIYFIQVSGANGTVMQKLTKAH